MDPQQEKVMRDLLSNNFASMISYLEAMNVEVKKKLRDIKKEQAKRKKSPVKINGNKQLVHDGTANESVAN